MLQAENVLFTIVLIGYFVMTIMNFAFVIMKKEKLAKAALLLQTGILVLHTAVLVLRGLGAKRWPMTNQYEFAVSFAWALCLVSLIFIRKYHFPVLGAFASPLILLMIGYAALQNREVRELMPSLRSSWLAFHVSTAIIAYGSFGVTFVLFGVVRATGAVVPPLLMLGLALWGVRVPFADALQPALGADAIWWSFPVSSLVSMLLSLAYYRWGGWRKAKMMDTPPHAEELATPSEIPACPPSPVADPDAALER